MFLQLAIALFLLFSFIQWRISTSGLNLPRVGPPTVFGYIWTALQSSYRTPALISEGWEKYSGRPFVLPTSSGSVVVVGPECLQLFQQNNDTVFSQPDAVNEILTLPQTMDKHQTINPYQITILRTDMSRSIPVLIPEVLEEITLAINESLNPPNAPESIAIPAFETMTHMVGRIMNRALVGLPMCRDFKYVNSMVQFTVSVAMCSHLLRWFPKPLRDPVYVLLSYIFGGKKDGLNIVVPFIEERMRYKEDTEAKPHTLAELLVRAAPPEELADPARIAMRLMSMNVASIHTTTMLTTQSLFEFAVLPQEQRDEIREEVIQALASEGHWNKASLAQCRKLDSFLKEVGRCHGLATIGLFRRAVQNGTLPDGSFIPAGYIIGLDMKRVHMDKTTYPNPETFDPFRFSKMEDDAKNGLTVLSNNYVTFGVGRHACPGRFILAMVVKLMLAHLLLHYDFQFPGGVKTRPANIAFQEAVLPDLKAKLVFKRRCE